MSKLGLKTEGGSDGVTVLKQAFNVDPIVQKQADCISAMRYNEYGQIIDAGLKPEDLTVFNYRDEGVGMLEDGLYTTEDKLADPANVDKYARFVKASMKGWEYASAHPDEAAQITVDADESGSQTLAHQLYMMTEISKLTAGSTGALVDADYKQDGGDPARGRRRDHQGARCGCRQPCGDRQGRHQVVRHRSMIFGMGALGRPFQFQTTFFSISGRPAAIRS